MKDLIEREAALACFHGWVDKHGDYNAPDDMPEYQRIEALPSAEPEIIRCGECKWYGRADKRRFYRGMDCLQKRIDTIVPDKDFCSRAERRTDE